MHQDEKIALKKEVLQRRWYEARMDKITLLNHPVDVLCDNVRQNATKVIISSSPLKSGLQVSVGHFFYLIFPKISHFWISVASGLVRLWGCPELDPVEDFLRKKPNGLRSWASCDLQGLLRQGAEKKARSAWLIPLAKNLDPLDSGVSMLSIDSQSFTWFGKCQEVILKWGLDRLLRPFSVQYNIDIEYISGEIFDLAAAKRVEILRWSACRCPSLQAQKTG